MQLMTNIAFPIGDDLGMLGAALDLRSIEIFSYQTTGEERRQIKYSVDQGTPDGGHLP